MKSEFLIAITQLAAERNLPKEVVLGAVEAALVSAFKKELQAENQDITVRILPSSGDIKVYALRTVVEKVADPQREVTLAAAAKLKANAQLGDTVESEIPFHNAGRIAAQTAKQVVMQRLREAERDLVHAEYAQKQGEMLSGVVVRPDPRGIIMDLGRIEGILPPTEQVPSERYRNGERVKLFVLEVSKTPKGSQIILSRTHKNLIRRLFELEVPEIAQGKVEIKAIAREPGLRTKVAVAATRQQGIDPVGSCVGQRGLRIQNIVNELRGEKIDVVEWNRDVAVFISKALSPAQVLGVELTEAENTARVVVPDRQLSLAIGKEGQNARLAAKLTGWRIDIKSATEVEAARAQSAAQQAEATAAVLAAAPAAGEAAPAPAAEEAPVAPALIAAEAAPAAEETTAAPAPIAAEAATAAEEPAPAAAPQEAPTPGLLPEEIVWKIPEVVAAGKSKIRFAEDILGDRGKGKVPEKAREEDTAKAKTKKPKRARKPAHEEEEEYEGFIR
ncbi:MAG: transcription termination factor NusA [Dehalococcoidia bacterium]|nr:transcription termination factor NusA [Dehalococcoidia bacterium]